MRKIVAPQFRPHPEFVGMTHGLQESNRWGRAPEAYAIRTIGHGGDMLGFKSFMLIVPTLNIGLFVAGNRNAEGGGGRVSFWRPVVDAVLDHFGQEKIIQPFALPTIDKSIDLKEYTGNYYFGVFCHSCSPEEWTLGGWRRSSNPLRFEIVNDTLCLGEDRFLPRGEDVFIRSDGYDMVYFGRNEQGEVSFFVFSDENNSFERMNN